MTPPAVIVTDVDTLRQIIRDEVAAVLAAQQPAPAPVSNEPAYYDVPEAAAHLKVSVSEIYRAVREGQIKRTPIGRGREYRISREALREYAQRQQREGGRFA